MEENQFLNTLDMMNETSLMWSIKSIPNVHEMNDKRYEIRCLNYIRDLKLEKFDVIVAESASCEGILRYCESENLQAIVLVDTTDLYTAGERHGRQFRASLIAKNCPRAAFIATTTQKISEARNLIRQIYPAGLIVEHDTKTEEMTPEMLSFMIRQCLVAIFAPNISINSQS